MAPRAASGSPARFAADVQGGPTAGPTKEHFTPDPAATLAPTGLPCFPRLTGLSRPVTKCSCYTRSRTAETSAWPGDRNRRCNVAELWLSVDGPTMVSPSFELGDAGVRARRDFGATRRAARGLSWEA
jgi:hypothetical protein